MNLKIREKKSRKFCLPAFPYSVNMCANRTAHTVPAPFGALDGILSPKL